MFLGRSQVEINPYARAVLQKRMQEGFLHQGIIHDDVTTYQVPQGTKAFGAGGGFPCQAGHSHCFAFLFYFDFLIECWIVRESLVVDTSKGFRTREVLCSSMFSRFSINSQSRKGPGRQSGVPSLLYCA